MSEDKMKRRRFLADLLFAGGVISAAALLAKATQPAGPTTLATGTPAPQSASPTPPPVQLDGDVAAPQPPVEPRLGGAVAPPQPQPRIKGDVAPPRRQPKR